MATKCCRLGSFRQADPRRAEILSRGPSAKNAGEELELDCAGGEWVPEGSNLSGLAAHNGRDGWEADVLVRSLKLPDVKLSGQRRSRLANTLMIF